MTEPTPASAPQPDEIAVPHAVHGVVKWLWVSVALLWGPVVLIVWAQVVERPAFQQLAVFMLLAGIVVTLVSYLFVLVEPGLFRVRIIKALVAASFTGFLFLSLITLILAQPGAVRPIPLTVHLLGLAGAVVLLALALRRNGRSLFVAALLLLFLATLLAGMFR